MRLVQLYRYVIWVPLGDFIIMCKLSIMAIMPWLVVIDCLNKMLGLVSIWVKDFYYSNDFFLFYNFGLAVWLAILYCENFAALEATFSYC